MLVPLPRSVFTLWILVAVGLASCVSAQFGRSPFVASISQIPTSGTAQWGSNQQSYLTPSQVPSDSSIMSQPFQTNLVPSGNNYAAPSNTGQFGNPSFVPQIPTTANGQWASNQQSYVQPSSPFLPNSDTVAQSFEPNQGQFGSPAFVPSVQQTSSAWSTQWGFSQPNFAQPSFYPSDTSAVSQPFQQNIVPSSNNYAPPSNTGQFGNPAFVPSILQTPQAGSTPWGVKQPSFPTSYSSTVNQPFQTNTGISSNNYAQPLDTGTTNERTFPSIFDFPPAGIADTTSQFNSQPVVPPFDPDVIAHSLIQKLPHKLEPPFPTDLIAQSIPPLFTPPDSSQTFQQGQQAPIQQEIGSLPSIFDANRLTQIIQNNEKLQEDLVEDSAAILPGWMQKFPQFTSPPLPAFGISNTPGSEDVVASPVSNFPPSVLPAIPNYNVPPLPAPTPSSNKADISQPIVSPTSGTFGIKTPISPLFDVPSETTGTNASTAESPFVPTNQYIQPSTDTSPENNAATVVDENVQPDSTQIFPIELTPEQGLPLTVDEQSKTGAKENDQKTDTQQTTVVDSGEERKSMQSFLHSMVSSGLALLKKMIENERNRSKSRSDVSRFSKQPSPVIVPSQAQPETPVQTGSESNVQTNSFDEDYIPWAFTIPSDTAFDDANQEILNESD